jgi:hypothetical protein
MIFELMKFKNNPPMVLEACCSERVLTVCFIYVSFSLRATFKINFIEV